MENQKTSHPSGLYTLFATEFWERFSYYGMRALLVLYLTATFANGGFGLERSAALEIYAIFTGLVYLTPILGGLLADKFLGQRKAIFIGGIVMAVGQFTIAASVSYQPEASVALRELLLYAGLGMIILGNGFLKPNISAIVGGLYDKDDPRKDSAFTIFYMGINAGALLAPLVAGYLGESVAWHWGYISAGTGMLISLIWFYAKRSTLNQVGLPPTSAPGRKSLVFKDMLEILYYSVACIAVIVGVVKLLDILSEDVRNMIVLTILVGGFTYVAWTIFKGTTGKTEWSRVGAIFVLAVFHVVFWSGFEQAGGTFNLFAKDNTQRMILGWEMPAAYFQSLNPVFIVMLGVPFSLLWVWLSGMGKNPRTPYKFGFGLILVGIGFLLMIVAQGRADTGVLVNPLFLVGVYFLHTAGELCISPVGLSLITKLAPDKIVSVMMGLWMASIALGNYLAGTMEAILENFDLPLYPFLAAESIGAGLLIIIIGPLLVKMMKGIH
jgi:POT family proton-dependent oligopeptide transporter